MYNPGKTTTDNVVPLNSKSQPKKPKTNHKKKSQENITIIPSKINDVFNRVPIKETYCKLVMLADESGTLIIRVRTLAKFLNTSEKTISRNLKELHIRELIIKDRFTDEYGYQKMIIHIINYNKLAEKDTYVGKPGQDVVGQIVNNQLHDKDTAGEIINRQLYKTWEKSNELKKDFYDLPKQIQESEFPLIEEQMFDKRIKTDDRRACASEHDIILANQPPLPPHKPTPSISGAVSYISEQTSKQKTEQTKDQDVEYLVRLIMGFGTREGQAKQMIDTYGYDVVLDKVKYVKSLEGIDRKGGYLMAVLKAHGKKNGIAPPHKPTTPEEKQASEDRQKLAQMHWENVNNWLNKNYLSVELYLNNPLIEHKGIIFELSEILQGNVKAYKNKTLNELLNGELMTVPKLRDLCDRLIGENPNQLMGKNETSQEPIKNIVPGQVEKAISTTESLSPSTGKPDKETMQEIMARLARSKKISKGVLTETSDKINAQKAKSRTETVERNRMVNEAFIEIVADANKMERQQKSVEAVNVHNEDENVHNKEKPNFHNNSDVHNNKQSKITSRQQEILEYIKANKNVDQKSIKGKYSNANEKTIRRDMKALLDNGFIASKGNSRNKIYTAV